MVANEMDTMPNDDHKIPNDDGVSPPDIQPEADLRGADLSEADLSGADLSGADLFGADLSGANLATANLNEADLVDTTLTDALLYDVTLSEALLSRGTDVDAPAERIRDYDIQEDIFSDRQGMYDSIARANHELRTVYSQNGLLRQARTARVRERRARRNEAREEGGLSGWRDYFLSWGARLFIGYGVKLGPVVGGMLVLYALSAAVYVREGMSLRDGLYYSIITLATAPPPPPPDTLLLQLVAGIETFAGTAAIVFVGFVLATRQRV